MLKAQKLAEEKAAKEAAKLAKEADQPKKVKEEEILDPTKYYENRSREVAALKN